MIHRSRIVVPMSTTSIRHKFHCVSVAPVWVTKAVDDTSFAPDGPSANAASGSEESENNFVSEHKARMREMRKLLLDKRKEMERKRTASFHQVKESLGKSNANDAFASVKDTLATFAQSELDFINSIFPEISAQCKKCVHPDAQDRPDQHENEKVIPEVMVDPLDAKMDPDYEPTKAIKK